MVGPRYTAKFIMSPNNSTYEYVLCRNNFYDIFQLQYKIAL
jgi:hypothetical protein